MTILHVDIVPWVLPNEHVPISITWKNREKGDILEIRLDKSIEIVEILNGQIIHKEENDDYLKISISPKFVNYQEALGYAGIVVTYPYIPNNQLTKFKFHSKLIQKSGKKFGNSSEILLFKPFLKLKEISIIKNRLASAA